MLLPQSFYNQSTLKVARDLLGCFLVRKDFLLTPSFVRRGSGAMRFKIVEIEAYDGPKDLASHASRGKTERNQVMFGGPGLIYVYFTYGMHYMLNIVTGPEDYPAAVLIRATSPPAPLHLTPGPSPSQGEGSKKEMGVMRTDGPGRLTKALGIDRSFNGLPVYIKKHGLWIDGRDEDLKPPQIARAARVGVDYAKEYKDKKWRFYIKGSRFVSLKNEIKFFKIK